MDTRSPPAGNPVPEDDLHALVDGRVPAHGRAAVEARLARDQEAAATLQAWQSQRSLLKDLHAELLNEPVPATLAAAAQRAADTRHQAGQWWRWGGMAAGVVLAFGVGWLSHGRFAMEPSASQAGARLAAAAAGNARLFAHQATVAHAIYVPEVRHPVEVAAAQQEHLVQWLSKRLNRPLKVPNLAAQGYELVGGRLLPGDDGARAQFMFQNAGGERITLYLGAVKAQSTGPVAPAAPVASAAAAPALDRRETAFSFSTDGPVPGFYWVDQGFGYALAGNLQRDRLMAIAQAVYEQL